MSDSQKQQQLEQKNYQFRIQLEQLQEDQLALKKEQRYIEEQQEAFFQLQQKEQAAYNFVLNNCEAEERPLLQERGDDSLYLAKKAQQAFEEQLLQLEKENHTLNDQEDQLNNEQRAFWKAQEVRTNGA